MFHQLHEYFKTKNLYYNHQYGFRELHSTELACLELVDRLLIDIDESDVPIYLFMDLSEAFDTLGHNILLAKLKYYGITGTALRLFKNYLTNRKQYVDFDGISSSLADITTGVPQGSILGPLLFIIYINDLSNVSKIFHPIIYADDTTLLSTLQVFQTKDSAVNVSANINQELLEITKWMKLNKLSLNAKKTKFMIFSNPQKVITTPDILVDNTKIECVDNFNFLGITLDRHLNWNAHLDKIATKLSQTIGIMYKLKEYLPQNIMKTIYNSLLLPHLNYGILVWGHKSSRIISLQKKAVRIVNHSQYLAHTEPIFKSLKLLKLNDIFLHQQLMFYYKFVNKQLPVYFSNLPIKSATHGYQTRNKNKIFKIRTRLVSTRNCIRHDLVETLNNTSETVKIKAHTHSKSGFSFYAKTYFIDKYTDVCTEPNCYVCKVE